MLWRIALVLFTPLALFACFFARAWSEVGACWVVAMLVYGLARAPKRGLFGQLALPLVFSLASFLGGTFGYFAGSAEYLGGGLPGFRYGNLDRTTRVRSRSTGCMITGLELFTHLPNNLAIDLLSGALGPMRGAYTGPFPEETEALAMVRAKGERISREDVMAGRLPLNGQQLALSEDLTAYLKSSFRDAEGDLQVLSLGGGAVLVGGERNWGGGEEVAPVVALVDLEQGRRVARWGYPEQRRTPQ